MAELKTELTPEPAQKLKSGIESTQEIPTQKLNDRPSEGVAVELLYRGNTIVINVADLPYKMGRGEEDCHLFIPAMVASRNHCTICLEDGRLGIEDNSTNGTFVKIGQAGEICVKGEFFPLLGKGMIKLGEPVESGEKNLIYFKCP